MADLAVNQLQGFSCACNNGESQKKVEVSTRGGGSCANNPVFLCVGIEGKTAECPMSLARIDMVQSQQFYPHFGRIQGWILRKFGSGGSYLK